MIVSEVIDRVYGEWLFPAGIDRPNFDILNGTITDSALSLVLEGRIVNVPRDTVLEIDSELILVKDNVSAPTYALAQRGYLDSAKAAHTTGALAYVNPKYPRVTLLNHLRTTIRRLYPLGLYWRNTDTTQTFSTKAVKTLPTDGKKILSILVRVLGADERYSELRPGFDYREYHQFTPPKYQLFRGGGEPQALTVTYAKDFGVPAAETEDLDTLGLPVTLQEHLPIAIAGRALLGRDVPRAMVDEIRRLLAERTGGATFGAALSAGQALISIFERKYVMEERRRLDELDPPTFEWVRGR